MENKYHVGDWVEFMTDQRTVKTGQIYEVKAYTKRFNATRQAMAHSEIVTDAPLGYRILNYQGQIVDKQILRKTNERRTN